MNAKHNKPQMKGRVMKARIVDGVKYRSSSEYVRALLEGAHVSLLTDSDIARLAKVTPQTVYAIKRKMLRGGYADQQ